MTAVEAVQAIEVLLDGIFGQGDPLSIAWPGAPYDPEARTQSMWLKPDIIWGDGFLLTKDGGVEGVDRTFGVLQVAFYGPRDGGDGGLLAFAENARNVFGRTRLGTDSELVFGAASGPRMSYEEQWRVATVSIPFSMTAVSLAT